MINRIYGSPLAEKLGANECKIHQEISLMNQIIKLIIRIVINVAHRKMKAENRAKRM